jgi:hypothetical protein
VERGWSGTEAAEQQGDGATGMGAETAQEGRLGVYEGCCFHFF